VLLPGVIEASYIIGRLLAVDKSRLHTPQLGKRVAVIGLSSFVRRGDFAQARRRAPISLCTSAGDAVREPGTLRDEPTVWRSPPATRGVRRGARRRRIRCRLTAPTRTPRSARSSAVCCLRGASRESAARNSESAPATTLRCSRRSEGTSRELSACSHPASARRQRTCGGLGRASSRRFSMRSQAARRMPTGWRLPPVPGWCAGELRVVLGADRLQKGALLVSPTCCVGRQGRYDSVASVPPRDPGG
jgi:hypothetical protein